MGKPPTTDQELQARVAQLEARADATDAVLAEHGQAIGHLDARVTALEELITEEPPTPEPPVISGGPILPPDRPDHTLPTPEPQPPEPTGGSYVVIEFADRQLHYFNQDDGIDLGDYVDPKGRFTQRCIAVTNPAVPDFLVMFRPDVDGSRNEVVFEFGRCHGTPAGSTLGPYSASICLDSNDTSIGIDVPKHYFYSRWRWQSAPRPVTASAADLVAAKLVPQLDKTLVPGMRAGVHTDDGPMMPNGITTYMGTTGERDDIGVLTESQADYLMHEDAQGLGTVRAWLEGSGAFPWHHRDENTGAPLDFVTAYPGAGTYNGAQPQIALYYTYEEELWPDTSHAPDLAYVPFLLTGDPYALEELQFQATFDYVALGTKDFCMSGSLRAYAWHMRNVAHCVTATPASVPKWLQPKAHWQTYLDRALGFSLDCGPRKAAGTWQQRFSDMSVAVNTYGEVAGLMEEYTMAVFLHMADLGVSGWDAMRDWKIQGVIARTNGSSGYNRSIPAAYIRVVTEGSPAAPVFADWAALQAWNAGPQGYNNQGAYYTPNDPTQAHLATNNPTLNYGYISYALACLNWAVRQGVGEAAPCAAWLGPEMVGKIPYMRWAVA